MLPSYNDITRRLGEPLWHDEHGVPRYDPFHPNMLGVYDDIAALVEVTCQGCDRRMLVGIGYDKNWLKVGGKQVYPPSDKEPGSFYIGDPPIHNDESGLCVGTTMSSGVSRIVEFWERRMEWTRQHEYEFIYEEEAL